MSFFYIFESLTIFIWCLLRCMFVRCWLGFRQKIFKYCKYFSYSSCFIRIFGNFLFNKHYREKSPTSLI